jgi:hypothetical protein
VHKVRREAGLKDAFVKREADTEAEGEVVHGVKGRLEEAREHASTVAHAPPRLPARCALGWIHLGCVAAPVDAQVLGLPPWNEADLDWAVSEYGSAKAYPWGGTSVVAGLWDRKGTYLGLHPVFTHSPQPGVMAGKCGVNVCKS